MVTVACACHEHTHAGRGRDGGTHLLHQVAVGVHERLVAVEQIPDLLVCLVLSMLDGDLKVLLVLLERVELVDEPLALAFGFVVLLLQPLQLAVLLVLLLLLLLRLHLSALAL